VAPPRNRQARKGTHPWMMPPGRPAAPVLHPLNNCSDSAWMVGYTEVEQMRHSGRYTFISGSAFVWRSAFHLAGYRRQPAE
jgi:hypothetical protein